MKTTDNINLSDIFEFVKRWQATERTSREAEFERVSIARELRQRFAPGPNGDHDFKQCCIVHFKKSDADASVMLTMARAALVFKNALEFKTAGGERGCELISRDEPAEQESILRAAKAEDYTIGKIFRRRHPEKKSNRGTRAWDAQRLSERLLKVDPDMPKSVREIVARYVTLETKRPRA